MTTQGMKELPLAHLSVRVAWHDTDWTGKVCSAPGANHACTILKSIKEKKDTDREEDVAGQPWPDQASQEDVPPCVFERAGFMRAKPFSVTRTHAYARSKRNRETHGHFRPTVHRMPPYSFEAVPYRWTRRESIEEITRQWGISYDPALEDRADKLMGWNSEWVQDHRNQRALLDAFFSAIRVRESLALVYAKDVPLLEDHLPGARVLIGAGLVTNIEASDEWSYEGDSKNWPLRSVMWEHAVGHSIRPDFKDGFLLPYQQLLADKRLAGEDLSSFVAHAPSDHFDEFSNVSEHVGHDGAIAALLEMARVVDLLPGVISGAWETVGAWLSDRIGDAWTLRGPYPGIGSVLSAAGLERGALIAYRVTESLADPAMDPWPALAEAITEATNGRGVANDLVGRMARKAWDRITSDPQRFQLLKMLARFELTTAQARRLFDNKQRSAEGWTVSDRELLENPYLLYELERGRLGAISLQIVDRGLFPRTAAARSVLEADPLPDQVTESVDDRRVRAACTYLLEQAAEKGHTLMDEQGLRRRLAELNLDPECVPNSDLFELATDGFPPALLETPLAGATNRGWQLARLAGASRRISSEVSSRMARGPIEATWDWRAEIDRAIDDSASPLALDEEAALTEKAVALKILARSRIAALVGPAGSGKTTMLKALCMHPEVQPRGVLLLAPTGKARVQLGDKVGARALTLAQFLRTSGRWHYERGYRMKPEEMRERGYATVVVDEASMLTEEMLAALLDALEGVERIILCGDPRQLPPLGAGRPFFDLVHYLRESQEGEEKGGGGIAELT